MRRTAHWLDAHFVVLATTTLVAWSVLALGGRDSLTSPAFCFAGPLPVAPLPASFSLALLLNPPMKLAFGWMLMVVAMMSPLLGAPLRHVRERSFANRRTCAMLLFTAGYMGVWMVAGAGLQLMALALRAVVPVPLASLGLAAATTTLWQVTPFKQWCLNRCHRLPHLAAFGAAANRDAFVFGLMSGLSCAGSCWALMLLPLCAAHGHLLIMIAVTVFIIIERFERPAPLAWSLRVPAKAMRIIAAQARMQLAPWTGHAISELPNN
jgi:predicted metal-binding membrane protein